MNLICYRTNETIREATIAEAIESLAAVDASADQIADEIRAASFDDAESFGREVAS
jgi:hypothetical protein